MPFLVWKDSMNIGIAKIDEQHMELARAINALYESSTAGEREKEKAIAKALNMLVSYADYHFKTEEDLMKHYGYPQFPKHKAEHDEFASKVVEMNEDMERIGNRLDYREFSQFVRDWFLDHTQGTDREFAPFFKAKGIISRKKM